MRSDNADATRRRVLLGIGTAVAAGLAGCGGDGGDGTETATDTETSMATPTESEMMSTATDTPTEAMSTPTETSAGTAAVRVAHMSPNAPNVDVYVDGSAVLEDVPFGAVSAYLEVPAGERDVEITAAGDADTSVFAGAVPVEAETAYTIAATGELGDDVDKPFEPLVFEDDNSEVADDEARLRAVHASPDAPAVDITAAGGDVVLFDGVEYGGSGYVTVEANDYTVEIRGDTETNDGDVVADFDVSLNGGTVYTAFAAGYLTPDDDPADVGFDLLVAQDSGGMSG